MWCVYALVYACMFSLVLLCAASCNSFYLSVYVRAMQYALLSDSTHTRTDTHTHTHTQTQTHTQSCVRSRDVTYQTDTQGTPQSRYLSDSSQTDNPNIRGQQKAQH